MSDADLSFSALFDNTLDRRPSSSTKWQKYAGRDILPAWIADMDFVVLPAIREALQGVVDQGIHGYTDRPEGLADTFANWLAGYCSYRPDLDSQVWMPGIVPALNVAAKALGGSGGAVAITTPIYYPFLDVASNAGLPSIQFPLLQRTQTGGVPRWEMDFDHMAELADAQPISAFLLCNPHNPTGRAYTQQELTQLAEFCLQRDITIVSDEIHCPLVLDPAAQHIGIATLAPEVARKTITLHAPTKAWNLAGASSAVALIEDPHLRERFRHARAGMISNISPFAYAAATAAYRDRSSYLDELRRYLSDNHALLQTTLSGVAPGLAASVEATYLAWVDVRQFPTIMAHAQKHSVGHWFEQQGLGLSDGADFAGPGFVRINFALPRTKLVQLLDRLERALRAGAC